MKYKYLKTTSDQDKILVQCFDEFHDGIGADYLAYTPQFNRIFAEFQKRTNAGLSQHTVWCNMIRVRKGGGRIKN